MLKPYAQRILRSVGLHDRLRVSSVYDAYWKIADQNRIRNRDTEVRFYHDLLDGFLPGDLIFDIGANAGEKTDIFLRLGAHVVAVEPDDHNQEVLRRKFVKYRVTPKPVVIVDRAVSDSVGIATMWIDSPGSALNTLSEKWADALKGDDERRTAHPRDKLEFKQTKDVRTTTLDELISSHGTPLFIKIDVEGFELQVLRGLSRPVAYLSFEVNVPQFRADALQGLDLLQSLSGDGQFNYAADCKRGLALEQWVDRAKFADVLRGCTEGCIEVFWRSRVARGAKA